MIKYILIFFLIGCARDPKDIGKIIQEYKWICVKKRTEIDPRISLNGDFSLGTTTSCDVTKCFKVKKVLKKYFSDEIGRELVEDQLCIN